MNEYSTIEIEGNDKSNYKSQKVPLYNKRNITEDEKKEKKIKEMQMMYINYPRNMMNPYSDDNYIFYNQAKFMEDFTDDYQYKIDAYDSDVNYYYLTINQLRTYYTWRTNVRNHIVEVTSAAYVRLYISELINLIGVKNKEEGWDQIISFWKEYRNLRDFTGIDELFTNVILSYAICHRMPYDYETILRFFPPDVRENWEHFDNHMTNAEENIYKIETLSYFSTYNIDKSKFYQSEYGYLFNLVIPNVFKKLDEYLNNYNLSFSEVVIKVDSGEEKFFMFDGLPYYESKNRNNEEVILNKYYYYICKKNKWYRKVYFYNYSAEIIGIILRRIEEHLRIRVGYRKLNYSKKYDVNNYVFNKKSKKLNDVLKSEMFYETIEKSIDEVLNKEEKRKEQERIKKLRDEFKIDTSNFECIRESSKRVEDKLIIEDELEEDNVELPNDIPNQETELEMGYIPFYKSLDNNEKKFISMVINGDNFDIIKNEVSKWNILLEVIIENINMKALDYIGDNLIYEDSGINIYEEYIEEIKKVMDGDSYE